MSSRDRSHFTDRVLSISAIVAAIAAVVVAVYEARAARRYQEISVWPYLYQDNAFLHDSVYVRRVANAGTGPARIRSFAISVNGRSMRHWGDVITALTGDTTYPSFLYYSGIGAGSVLLPGDTVAILTLRQGEQATRFHRAVGRASIRVCYCSLYEQCWLSDSRTSEPREVTSCPALAPGAEFQR